MAKKRKETDKFKLLGTRSIFRGRVFELKKVRMKAPDGHEFQHDVVFHPGAVVIVPLLNRNRFVLVKQYRAATRRVIWEFPAGTLEDREDPLACAKREIIEETGFEAKRWRKLAAFYPAPGVSTEFMHIFLASGLLPKPMMLDRDEFLERRIISFSHLQRMVLNGTIMDGKTMLGFFYFCRVQHKLSKFLYH